MATDQLIETGLIKKTPGVCGGDACIGNRRIPVWQIIEGKQLGYSDDLIRNRYEDPLTLDELNAAFDYYTVHHDEIDEAIVENERAMHDDFE